MELDPIGSGSGPGWLLLTSRNHDPARSSALCLRKLRSDFHLSLQLLGLSLNQCDPSERVGSADWPIWRGYCHTLERGYGTVVLAPTSTRTRSLVKCSSYRLHQFSARPSCLRFHGSGGNSQNASCFADRKMIHKPEVKRLPKSR